MEEETPPKEMNKEIFDIEEVTARTKDIKQRLSVYFNVPRISKSFNEVIKMYFGIGLPHALSLDEIAMTFGLTRERVRQIKEKGIKRLRVSSKSKHLQAYL